MVVLFSVLWVLALLPGTAFGYRIYQGDDYSQHADDHHRMVICDFEGDLNQAYTKYHTYAGEFRRLQDTNGAGGTCPVGDYYPSGVYDHDTCEDRNLRPDPCTPYGY